MNSKLHFVATLDITLLRPEEPGRIVTQGGDIDNRLKTLLDALTIPKPDQIPKGWSPEDGEQPFHCLLEDDNEAVSKIALRGRMLQRTHLINRKGVTFAQDRRPLERLSDIFETASISLRG